MDQQGGPLAFYGGDEASGTSALEQELIAYGGGTVTLLPAGAAYERPELVEARAASHFSELGAKVATVAILNRRDASSPELAEALRSASFIYLPGNSPLHLRSVLKDSAALAALVAAWHDGAVVAGSAAGATVLSDPMVDPRGGALTVGLGLVRDVAFVPGYEGEISPGLRRTLALAPEGCALVALGPGSLLVRETAGTWRADGGGPVSVFLDGVEADLDALAGKPVW